MVSILITFCMHSPTKIAHLMNRLLSVMKMERIPEFKCVVILFSILISDFFPQNAVELWGTIGQAELKP